MIHGQTFVQERWPTHTILRLHYWFSEPTRTLREGVIEIPGAAVCMRDDHCRAVCFFPPWYARGRLNHGTEHPGSRLQWRRWMPSVMHLFPARSWRGEDDSSSRHQGACLLIYHHECVSTLVYALAFLSIQFFFLYRELTFDKTQLWNIIDFTVTSLTWISFKKHGLLILSRSVQI